MQFKKLFFNMANVWFSVILLVFINQVSAKSDCDECIRRGSTWCTAAQSDGFLCEANPNDDWCEEHREDLHGIDSYGKKGVYLNPVYSKQTVNVGSSTQIKRETITFELPDGVKDPQIKIKPSTTTGVGFDASIAEKKCIANNCSVIIRTTLESTYCTQNSTPVEYADVYVKVEGINETAWIRYHVPCACNCSAKGELNSTVCNNHGDFVCGACQCHGVWIGNFCEKANCPPNRGDLRPCVKSPFACSGNGYCDDCESCVCHTDRDGSQYFDASNECKDICMTSECDTCLRNGSLGYCQECNLSIHKYNKSLTNARDSQGRKEWIPCNITVDDCYIEYVAMKTDHIHVMVVSSCNDGPTQGAWAGGSKASMIMGVLFGVAVVASMAGFLMWKHLNAQAAPVNSGGYGNIEAETYAEENPIYKPPMTSFKNPAYGKVM